jgi:hypothetical protein
MMKNTYNILVGNPERKISDHSENLRRWEDNIKTDLREKGLGVN